MDDRRRAGHHRFPAKALVAAIVKVVDIGEFAVPDIVQVLVDVLHRVPDVDVLLVDADDADKLPQHAEYGANRGLGNIRIRRQIHGIEVTGPGTCGIDLDKDLFPDGVADGALPPGRVVVHEDRIPGFAVAVLPCKVPQGCRNHPVDHGLVVVLAQIPPVARGIDDAALVNGAWIMHPNHPSRVDALCDPHWLIRSDRRRCKHVARAVGSRGGASKSKCNSCRNACQATTVKCLHWIE